MFTHNHAKESCSWINKAPINLAMPQRFCLKFKHYNLNVNHYPLVANEVL